MKLTIVCLSAALALVFFGTLAQAHSDTHAVQERYFQSLLVWWPADSNGLQIPVFPGGHLLGAVLLVNLLAAHLRRFRLNLRNAGLHLIHGGLVIMLAGGLFTDLCSVESVMELRPGETKSYSVDAWRPIRYEKPYSITLNNFIHESYPGTDIPKKFVSQITLRDPAHGVNREVQISMNHPFRYAGETYYQAGFGSGDQSSILQVVRNPGFAAPYVACAIIGLGLLVQFGRRFIGFTRRTKILT